MQLIAVFIFFGDRTDPIPRHLFSTQALTKRREGGFPFGIGRSVCRIRREFGFAHAAPPRCNRYFPANRAERAGPGGEASDTVQGVSENCQEVLLSAMPQVASRGPFGVIRQAVWPSSTWRPGARQVHSAAAAGHDASSAAISTTAADGPSLCMAKG